MALILCNLVSPKVVDKISKLITKTDVLYLQKYQDLPAVEQLLANGWKLMLKAAKDGKQTLEVGYGNFGKFAVRVMLHVLKKERLGVEARGYQSLHAIEFLFKADLDKKADIRMQSSSSYQAQESSTLTTLEQSSSPAWIAQQKEFEAGKLYTYVDLKTEGVPHDKKIVIIKEMTDAAVVLETVSILSDQPEAFNISYDQLCNLTKFNGKPPMNLSDDIIKHLPQHSEHFRLEASKSSLFSTMGKAAIDSTISLGALKFGINPFLLMTNKAFKKNELKLPLATDAMNRIHCEPNKCGIHVKHDGVDFWVLMPAMPRTVIMADVPKSMVVIPFWFVGSTSCKEDVNMEFRQSTRELVNVRALKAGEMLKKFEDEKDPVEAGPKKKAKKA